MSTDPSDPLVEAALTATEGGHVDWEHLREELPGERDTIEELATLATVVAAHRSGPDRDEVDGGSQFRWGPLEIRRRIGSGSYGEVFVAWDPRLQREVALKLRHAGTAEGSRRWLEEARRLARVRHPDVVTVYGADLHDERAGMWMEPVRGRTLEERLQREGPLSAREAALVGADLCAALAAVHAAGLVHGDVKTHNVMREGAPGEPREAGRIVLMDFGSAHESASEELAPGTPLFTAPEVLAGQRGTPASDLWSLGVVLYRLVTGRWPVEAKSLPELREALASGGPTPLRSLRPDLPAGFVTAVESALERDPARRWRDAAVFERELLGSIGLDRGAAAESERRRVQGRHRARLALASALLALLVVAGSLGVTQGEKLRMAWRMRGLPLAGEMVAERAGGSANAFLGSWVMNVGDLDGDDLDEVASSAYGANEIGQVLVFSSTRSTLEPILTLNGENPNDQFAALAAGDLNGDGHRDLVVTAALHDTKAGGKDAGRIYVYFCGPTMDAVPDVVLDGAHPAQYFGYGVGCGDVNGDGRDDLLVGAPYDRRSGPIMGRAWVYFGGPAFDTVPDLELSQPRENTGFGITVAHTGDLNGDGFGDLAVGALDDPGRGRSRGAAYVYFGGPRLDDRPDLVLHGRVDQGVFGAVRQRTGDLNGDGYADLVVAGERDNGLEARSGAVMVYFGGPDMDATPDLRLKGERRGDGFGVWVDGSRDVDGDGSADLFVGAPWYDSRHGDAAGRGYVFLGGPRIDDVPDYVVTGSPSSLLGYGCLVPGERGGIGSLVVGLKNETRGLTQCGVVQLHDLERWVLRPPQPQDGWAPGGTGALRWSGSTRAEVSLSIDGGHAWRSIARQAGGDRQNVVRVPVPSEARDQILIRLARGRDVVEREIRLESAGTGQ